MFITNMLPVFILITGAALSVLYKKLTIAAAITSVLCGYCIFAGAGYTGLMMMAAFFILGTAATAWKIKTKQSLALAETNKGKRNSLQVIANAGVAAMLGVCVLLFPQRTNILVVMMAAAFASAAADTVSSELGNIYGSRFYNILTLKKDTRGLNGVVSIAGTLAGIIASIIIAIIYSAGLGFSINFLWIVIAGTAGNLFDSVLGATLERSNIIGNNAVNFLNTLFAAFTAFLFMLIKI